jgi:transcriptional regulator with XRE-family HTH domain
MSNKEKEQLAKRLLAMRHARRWTMERMAGAIGISRSTLFRAESGNFAGEKKRSLFLIHKFLESAT